MQNLVKIGKKTSSDEKITSILESRVRHFLQREHIIKKGDTLLVINDQSTESKVTIAILKSIIKEEIISIKEKKVKKNWESELLSVKKPYDIMIIPKTQEEYANFLEALHFKSQVEKKPIKNITSILQNISEKEVEAYAKAKKL